MHTLRRYLDENSLKKSKKGNPTLEVYLRVHCVIPVRNGSRANKSASNLNVSNCERQKKNVHLSDMRHYLIFTNNSVLAVVGVGHKIRKETKVNTPR